METQNVLFVEAVPKGAQSYILGQHFKIVRGKAFVHRLGEWKRTTVTTQDIKREQNQNNIR